MSALPIFWDGGGRKLAKRIFKYDLDENSSVVARAEKILDVQIQRGRLVAWILIDDEADEIIMEFTTIGTGWPMSSDMMDSLGDYIATVQECDLVWHVFVKEYRDLP